MKIYARNHEVPSLICHLARQDQIRGIGLMADWTREKYVATLDQVTASQNDMQESLKLAAARLNATPKAPAAPTLNGLLTQGFEGGRLVAIPAIGGMVGPAVLAVFDDKSSRAFQYRAGELVDAPIANPGNKKDIGINLDSKSKATIRLNNLQLVVNSYSSEGDSFRITSDNTEGRKTTFTSYTAGEVVKTTVLHGGLNDSYVHARNGRFEINADADGVLTTSFLN